MMNAQPNLRQFSNKNAIPFLHQLADLLTILVNDAFQKILAKVFNLKLHAQELSPKIFIKKNVFGIPKKQILNAKKLTKNVQIIINMSILITFQAMFVVI